MKDTPLLRQYAGFKKQYPDKILLFRMGDFFETFGDDAKLAAKALNITLTQRSKKDDPTPMAGFPHHALEQYLPKLIKVGYCVVIVDQVEDPKQATGLVKRAVTRIVTPGTLDPDENLEKKSQNIVAVFKKKENIGVAICDIYTGDLKITETHEGALETVINSYEPVEALLLENEDKVQFGDLPVQFVDSGVGKAEQAEKIIKDHLNIKSLESLGIAEYEYAYTAAAMVLQYIEETQKLKPEHINEIKYFKRDGTMVLDRATIRNLELTFSDSGNTLLKILDETKTSMGRRLLRYWILNPLIEVTEIKKRLDWVDVYFNNYEKVLEVREILSEINDIEKLTGKMGLNRINARDYKALEYSLDNVAELVKKIPVKSDEGECKDKISGFLGKLEPFRKTISETIVEKPPNEITEGGIIKYGYDEKVDEYRDLAGNSKDWVKEFEEKEKKRTGIGTLKVDSNKVYGYYIEVTKTHTDKVPDDYIRKQTLVNSERYFTDELKKKEEVINEAEEKLAILEYEIFQEFREESLKYISDLQRLSHEVARMDVFSDFAFLATNYDYIKPEVKDFGENTGELEIKGGRHPVVERVCEMDLDSEPFIPNDVILNLKDTRLAIITGPNMSGKSTYIRQVAVLTLMAQIGCFIPATEAKISIVDRIFTRVGAHDDLSQGRSTFMVEMDEAANILNNATKNSLVILDEVGRGTSTYDGVSIAWAISEYLLDEIGCRTLFATHYHELLTLEDQRKGVKNFNVSVDEREDGDEVTFLRKIVEGGTDKSYGIYVGKLAGLPPQVLSRAREILGKFEDNRQKDIEINSSKDKSEKKQILYKKSLFDYASHPVVDKIKSLDLNELSPIDALNKLNEFKEECEDD